MSISILLTIIGALFNTVPRTMSNAVYFLKDWIAELSPRKNHDINGNLGNGYTWALMSKPPETSRLWSKGILLLRPEFSLGGKIGNTWWIPSFHWACFKSGSVPDTQFALSNQIESLLSAQWQIESIYGSCRKLCIILWELILEDPDVPYEWLSCSGNNYL